MLPRAHHQFCFSEAGQVARFNVKHFTVEVGCRGLIDTTQFSELGTVLEVSHKKISHPFTSIIRTTVLESYKIWCCRNIHTSLSHPYYITPFCMYIFCDTVSVMVQCVICTNYSQRYIQPKKEVIQQPILSLPYTHIVQNAAGERPSYKGQLSMEKCCSQMAKVRRTLHSLTPRSILSLPIFHSPSLSLPFSPTSSLSSVCGVLRERFRDTKNNFFWFIPLSSH